MYSESVSINLSVRAEFLLTPLLFHCKLSIIIVSKALAGHDGKNIMNVYVLLPQATGCCKA